MFHSEIFIIYYQSKFIRIRRNMGLQLSEKNRRKIFHNVSFVLNLKPASDKMSGENRRVFFIFVS